MSVATTLTELPLTSRASMSWYLRPSHPSLAKAADLADALTVAGPKGPTTIRRLRESGFHVPVLFDGCGYAGKELPGAPAWVALQIEARADRLLLPGVYVPWDKDDNGRLLRAVKEQAGLSGDLDAGMLMALDSRWLAKKHQVIVDTLQDAGRPVALVLADRADPLAVGGAVAGLRWVAQRVPQLSILRSDHGALGAVAFGAVHAAIGLNTSTRHFVTTAMRPRKLPGGSSRVFVRQLIDWFRASEIAGWTAAGLDLCCRLPCCNGSELARFLDDDLDATWHNMNALADFADVVLNVNAEDRGIEFMNECRAAVSRYGLAGFKGPENPKAQLTGWALC
jgi:hypothetical protein